MTVPSGRPLPDTHLVLVAWGTATFPDARSASSTPAKLADVLPLIEFFRVGGHSDLTIDFPTVDVDVYAATKAAAFALARDVQHALSYVGGTIVDYNNGEVATILSADCPSGPSWRPYSNDAIARVGATYTLAVKPA